MEKANWQFLKNWESFTDRVGKVPDGEILVGESIVRQVSIKKVLVGDLEVLLLTWEVLLDNVIT